jgi:pyridinium-3,5-bisthiocarboxylic acid mononucleotide nickel chelatase
MKIAYFDCMSGLSGDMTLGALVDAGVELAALQAAIDSLQLPKPVRLTSSEVKRHGFRATKVNVEHEPEQAHRHLHHITDMIDASTGLTATQQDLAKRIFTRLGEAEAKVHGTTLRKVHFHEVGAIDSIADIVGAAVGITLLGVDKIVCSPVPTGTGTIVIEHGRVNVPAPATAELLKGIPLADSFHRGRWVWSVASHVHSNHCLRSWRPRSEGASQCSAIDDWRICIAERKRSYRSARDESR